jgi:molybdopterin molybdotransferase
MMEPDRAFELLAEKIRTWEPRTEIVPIGEAGGRIAAADVVSGEYVPRFDRSAMDGYAVISDDTAGATESEPVTLKVVGRIEMGRETDIRLERGECAAIPTGGMLPAGADGIVMVEDAEQVTAAAGAASAGGSADSGVSSAAGTDSAAADTADTAAATAAATIAVYAPAAPGRHIARRGEDVSPGDVAVSKGSVLTPGKIGALAALGFTGVEVFRPLDLFLISTGDELVPPAADPKPGKVRDINSYSVSALAAAHGFRVTGTLLIRDDADLLRREIAGRLESNDVICVSGGSSVGEKDITADIIGEVTGGGVFTHGIRIKPGKPTILAWNEGTQTVVAGLPGHPASAAVVFNLLFCRMSRTYTGTPDPVPVPAVLSGDVQGGKDRTRCQTVALSTGTGGVLKAEPIPGASGMITTLSKADGYIEIPRGADAIEKGATVMVHRLF